MLIHVQPHSLTTRRSGWHRRWLLAAVRASRSGHRFHWKDFLPSWKPFVPASILHSISPSPQDVGQTLYVDSSDPMAPDEVYAGSTHELSFGAISYNNELIGYNGSGTFNQTGGTNTIGGTLFLGYASGSNGTYNLSDTFTVSIVKIGRAGTVTTDQTSNNDTLSAAQEDIGYSGTSVFNQRGGTNTVSNILYVGPAQLYGGNGTYNLSAGTLSASYESVGLFDTGTFNQSGGTNAIRNSLRVGVGQLGYGESATYNLSGSGTLSTATENLGNNAVFLGSNGGAGTYDLNGGTLQTRAVALSGPGPGVPSTSFITGTFNFNGGTLQAAANNTTFMTGLTPAKVQAGRAIIDSNGYDITVGQPLLGGVSGGRDGGLIKQGMGILTLTGAGTFNGPTVLNAGTLALNSGSNPALGNTRAVTVNAGSTLSLGAASQLNPAATLTLNANSGPAAGATVAFNTGGYSQTLGALTLSSSSVIDLANGASVLRLGNSAGSWTGTLAVWNWTGTAITGGGTDERFFGTILCRSEVLPLDFRGMVEWKFCAARTRIAALRRCSPSRQGTIISECFITSFDLIPGASRSFICVAVFLPIPDAGRTFALPGTFAVDRGH